MQTSLLIDRLTGAVSGSETTLFGRRTADTDTSGCCTGRYAIHSETLVAVPSAARIKAALYRPAGMSSKWKSVVDKSYLWALSRTTTPANLLSSIASEKTLPVPVKAKPLFCRHATAATTSSCARIGQHAIIFGSTRHHANWCSNKSGLVSTGGHVEEMEIGGGQVISWILVVVVFVWSPKGFRSTNPPAREWMHWHQSFLFCKTQVRHDFMC
jgi:hypothetical protein